MPKHFVLFGNTYQADKHLTIKQILNAFNQFNAIISIEKIFFDFLTNELNIDLTKYKRIDTKELHDADYAISIGGDGTFLRTAKYVVNSNIPIIGINTGHLGFLSTISPNEIEDFFKELNNNNTHIEKHSLLNVTTSNDQIIDYPYALNEVAILKHDNSSMIQIDTMVDNHHVATFSADGLIISTPTGSTGYSLSVGGPIVSPDSSSLILSPIAAHSLTVRPVVIQDNAQIHLKINSRNGNYLISLDGRSQSLNQTTEITISKSNKTINVVRRNSTSFFDTLRNKLMWSTDSRI